ncbi:hopanoid-associated phosphorylase [Acetobacteraceae bacterium AT-5844]|nr:hopanoid-associated phosphorylase [Acetobacteraceae bacterium AT-5844]
MTILAVTGLRREQRILSAPGIEVLAGGGDAARLATLLEARAGEAEGIISIGIAGALAPGLQPGDWIVASAVRDGEDIWPTDPAWRARLAALLPGAREGVQLGRDAMVSSAAEKAALHQATGAIGVDMESHLAARAAGRHGARFAVARVVSDAADRDLPVAAQRGMRPDGGVDIPAVLRALAADPRQLPALIRTGWEAEKAFRALLGGHDRLGARLAAPGAGDAGLV